MATPPHEQQSATLLYFLTMLTQKRARKVVIKAGNNGFEAYRQLCLMYGTSDQEGSTGLFVQIMTYKFGSKIEDVKDRLNEFLELVRRYDEANGTDPYPDQLKEACIISNTPEPLKTHLQLNVAELGNNNALRVATEDYLGSRRIFKTTSAGNTHDEDSMEVDADSRKGKGKEKSGKGKKGGKKGKESHSDKGFGETTTEHPRFESECRNCGKYGHKAADCWYKQPPKPQGKGKGTKKSKSKVTEISESDNSKQVDDWNPSLNTSAQQPNSSQVNAIGCPDEGLWIFSLEDSKKRGYTVSCEDQSDWKTEEHELMTFWMFWSCLPTVVCTAFPMMSSTNVDAVAANNVALQHYEQKVVYGHVMTNSGKRIWIQIWFDVMKVCKPLLSTSALTHRDVTIIFNHDYDRSKRDSELGISRLSFLLARHFDKWNSSLQSVGDGWRKCGKWRGWGSLRQRWYRETWGSRSFSWWSTSNRRCGSSRTAWYFWWSENCKSTTYSWTAGRCCENGTHRDTRSIQILVPDQCCESRTTFTDESW